MRRADRLFQLILLLRRGRVTTAEKLARELQVSERTIYRDVQALSLSGVPIEGEAGVGYILRREFELPPLMFTREEAKALVLGARMVQAWGDAELKLAARNVIEKVGAVAPPDVKAAFDDETIQAPAFHVPEDVRACLAQVRKALEGRRKIRMGYTRADGAPSTRTVRPLGLFYWGNTWSLAAWCELRMGFRNFRLDRMGELKVLKTVYKEEAGKSLNDFIRAVSDE